MTCEICNQRPSAIYLTYNQLNKWACWHCTQWAITAVQNRQTIYRYVMRNEPQEEATHEPASHQP